MNELAVQSASDTNEDDVDRDALQAEFTALRSEIDDIANKTTFNNTKLLDGSFGTTTTIDNAASEIEPFMNGVKSITFNGFEGSVGGTAYSIAYTLATDTWTLSGGGAGTFVQDDAAGAQKYTLSFGANGSLGSVTIETDATHAIFADGDTLDFTVTNTGAKIQTGANAGETLDISISSMQAADLDASLATADISTRTGASAAITSTQNAINTVSTQRANLGAIQNRLEHKINNLNTSSENLQAAESRIRDIDMAKEMTNFTTQNILVQAATAMLAQANSAPQNVLSLLK
jgi:flagellin